MCLENQTVEEGREYITDLYWGIRSEKGGGEGEQLTRVMVIVVGAAGDRRKRRVALLALVPMRHRKEGEYNAPFTAALWPPLPDWSSVQRNLGLQGSFTLQMSLAVSETYPQMT